MDHTALFAAAGIAFYAGHHAGDYWVQTDYQARHKGDAGAWGVLNCAAHCASLVATQFVCLLAMELATGARAGMWQTPVALAVSGGTHYLADRREHGLMFRLARLLPGKAGFLKLGVPRPYDIYAQRRDADDPRGPMALDQPQLATGAWALDQAWHIFFGVFCAALVVAI